MTIHRIKLKDLDDGYIQKLKSEQKDGDVEVAIWVSGSKNMMKLKEFWKIISMMDRTADSNKEILQPSVNFLSQLPIKKIKAFENTLSKKLYQLDGIVYARNIGENAYKGEKHPFSSDVFLYARCAVISMGGEVFNNVLNHPETMLENQIFEPLLNLASLAYEQKNGKQFDYVPAYLYETFSNTEGWGGKGLLDNVFNQ